MLTNEEKRLLAKEGISLPGNYPLTKHEERELKRIRRKIRNKISAQDSRKRKKEYVDGLEERVKQCTDENQTLIKRLKLLQSQHNNLNNQVKKLQAMLSKGTNKTTQPATCLMVLLLSLALVAVPNLKLGQNAKDTDLADALQEGLLQNRRNLLFDTNEQLGDALVDEDLNLDDILAYNEINEHDYANVAQPPIVKKPKTFIEFDVDDKIWKPPMQYSPIASEFNGKAMEYQQKLSQSSGFNIGGSSNSKADDGIKVEKLEIKQENTMSTKELLSQATDNLLANGNLDKMSMYGVTSGNGKEMIYDQINLVGENLLKKKLNESKVNIGERKILMKGA